MFVIVKCMTLTLCTLRLFWVANTKGYMYISIDGVHINTKVRICTVVTMLLVYDGCT